MANVPTAIIAKGIEKLLNVIKTSGIPSKVDRNYLKTVGLKSGNDGALITVFKALGFIDSSGVPTSAWRDYKDTSKSKAVLGKAVRTAYADLFALYPDAHRKDDEAIRNWVRSATGASEVTVNRAMATFKILISHASFDDAASQNADPQAPESTGSESSQIKVGGKNYPSVNINIELQIPATDNPKVYENFFAAMKKNLLDDNS